MKTFQQREIREAQDYAAAGGQALHLMAGSFANIRRDTPGCFKGRRQIAHLFDQDRERLVMTARRCGVCVIKVEREGERGQHIDLCGKPLERAIEESKQIQWEEDHGLRPPERVLRPVLMVAHADVQLRTFLRNHQLARPHVRRLMGLQDIRGVSADRPVVRLEGWWRHFWGAREFEAIWHGHDGRFIDVSESCVLGREPLPDAVRALFVAVNAEGKA